MGAGVVTGMGAAAAMGGGAIDGRREVPGRGGMTGALARGEAAVNTGGFSRPIVPLRRTPYEPSGRGRP